jgi:RNA polymerase sigma-70 factor (ECF subfamily)
MFAHYRGKGPKPPSLHRPFASASRRFRKIANVLRSRGTNNTVGGGDLNKNPQCEFDELEGDAHEACSRFVYEEYAGVYGWLYRLAGRSDEAADLTQETFTAFWASFARRKQNVSLRTWLYAIARNQWRKRCRDRKPVSSTELEQIAAPASTWTTVECEEFTAAVTAVLAGLSEDLREAFSLRFWHDFDYAQIAAVQGTNAALARWRCFRARQIVRARLKPWRNDGGKPA